MILNLCENCGEKQGCDQVLYDCALHSFMDVNGFTYEFVNSKKEKFTANFKNFEDAKEFAYRAGLSLLGRL